MRTGAIFARGSCRALKWMALVGVVFALGVGSVAAQQTLSGGLVEVDVADSMEGGSTTITVTVSAEIESAAAGAGTKTTVTVTVAAAALATGTDDAALLALGNRVTPAEFNTTGQPDDFALGTGGSVALEFVFPEEERTPTGRSFTHKLSSKTVELQTRNHDDDAEDEGLRVTATPTGLTGASAVTDDVKITDKDPQMYELALDPKNQDLEEGDDVTVSLKAVPPHFQASETLTLNIDKAAPDYTFTITSTDTNAAGAISNNRVTIGNAATTDQVATATITLDTPANDRNRVLDTVTMTAYSGQAGAGTKEDELAIPLKDGNVLPGITAAVTDADGEAVEDGMLMEGMTYQLTFTAVDDDGDAVEAVEDLMVALTGGGSADPRDDYSLAMSSIAIAEGEESSAAVNLEVDLDDDIGNDTLTFMATVTGESANGTEPSDAGTVLSLTIVDGTAKLVEAKSTDDVYQVIMDATAMAGDDGVNPGESIEIPLDDMFQVAPGYSLSFGFDMEGSDVAAASATLAGSNLNVSALEPGQAKFTVTATANAMGSSVDILDQTTPNVAQVLFPIDVVLKPFADTMLSADPMTIEEGESSTITAMLSRMVHASEDAAMISLTASGGSLSADSIEIAAGMDSGTVMLMTEADDNYEGGTVTVVASGTGIDGNASVVITLTDSDEPPEPPEPTNVVTAKSSDEIYPLLMAAGLAGDDAMFNPGMMAELDPSEMFDVMEGYSASYGAESDDTMVASASTSGGMVTVTAGAAGMAHVTITATATMASGVMPGQPATNVATVMFPVNVVNVPLEITVSADPMAIMEGESSTITATANRNVTEDTTISLTVTGDTEAVSAPEMLTITTGMDSGTVMVMAVEDDDSMDASVSVVASGTGIANPMSMDIAITDNDPTVSALTQAEVDAVFTVAVAMAAGGADGWVPGGNAAEVDMSELFETNGDPTLEYTAESSAPDMVGVAASGSMLTLTPMETGDATITVTATDTSGDMNDTATVMSPVSVGILPLEITVSPTTAEVDEGGMVEIMATANKMVDANVEVMLLPDVTGSTAGDDDYSLDPTLITIMAGDAMGKTTLTATDDYEVEGDESLTLIARVKDHGDVGTVMVSIMDNDMETTFELSGPMDMNIVEGESYELTATASQAVHMDTEVMLMRDRAASDASDDDYTVGSITIAAGESSGTTMLMVTEDNMPDAGEGTNMGESLVLIGSVDGMEVGSLEFIIWDAAVPALPVIAQLLLAAFLALGGYRRYRRR